MGFISNINYLLVVYVDAGACAIVPETKMDGDSCLDGEVRVVELSADLSCNYLCFIRVTVYKVYAFINVVSPHIIPPISCESSAENASLK